MDKTPVNGLVVSGLAQIALGALVGFPYAVATYKPDLLRTLRVRAPGRVRQLHLDLIMMGGLVTATGTALPQLPRVVAVPLAVGCWTNALAFAPPAIKPSIEDSRAFRALVTASFVTTSTSWVTVAAIALRRWRAAHRPVTAPRRPGRGATLPRAGGRPSRRSRARRPPWGS